MLVNPNKSDYKISSIDRNLTNEFSEFYKVKKITPSNLKPLIEKSKDNKRYIINNQANVKSAYDFRPKGHFFCPISSIFDSMPTCSYSQAISFDDFEYSDKYNIKLTNTKDGTNLQLIINFNKNSDKATITVINSMYAQPHTIIKTNITKEKELEANYVFSTLLDKIKDKLKYSSFISKEKVWEYLDDDSIFTDLSRIGMRKGLGDFLQEVMDVCKNGGMVRTPKYVLNKTLKYDYDGKATRLGLMGDGPSGCRLLFMLSNGKGDINTKAMGGFFSPSPQNSIIIKRETPNKPLPQT